MFANAVRFSPHSVVSIIFVFFRFPALTAISQFLCASLANAIDPTPHSATHKLFLNLLFTAFTARMFSTTTVADSITSWILSCERQGTCAPDRMICTSIHNGVTKKPKIC